MLNKIFLSNMYMSKYRAGGSNDLAPLQNIYILLIMISFFSGRNSEPENLLILLVPSCLGNTCEPQKLLSI